MTAVARIKDGVKRKRPWSVLAVGALFLVLGIFDLWKGATPLFAQPPHLAIDDVEVMVIGVAALIGAVWLLRGCNWARWLLVAWMALHTALNAAQISELLGHAIIFALVLAGLFHPVASAWFRSSEGKRADIPP